MDQKTTKISELFSLVSDCSIINYEEKVKSKAVPKLN
jgi:hypothetical protein